MNPALRVALHPSRRLAAWLLVLHGAACAALLATGLPAWARIALAALVLSSLILHMRRDAWLSAADSPVFLSLQGDEAAVLLRGGGRLSGRLSSGSLVTPELTVLTLARQGLRPGRSITLLPDGLDPETFRQLRVRLRWDVQRGA